MHQSVSKYLKETSDTCITEATLTCCYKKCDLEELGVACASAYAGLDEYKAVLFGCADLKCAYPLYGLKGAAAAQMMP